METATVCMINQKGGSGKSSNCFHLAGHFGASGQSVLLIDADPQASLTQGFFGSAATENLAANETLAAIFGDTAFTPPPDALVRDTAFNGISIIPANQTLAPHNKPSPENEGMEQFAVSELVAGLKQFDLILIDCPPNLYQCSWSAMIAADYVLVPVPPEDFGTQGLRVVHQAITNARRLNPKLRLLGHVVTRYDGRLLVHRAYEKRLRGLYGDSVLKTVIPEAAAFKVSLSSRTPVSYPSPRSSDL